MDKTNMLLLIRDALIEYDGVVPEGEDDIELADMAVVDGALLVRVNGEAWEINAGTM